MRTKRPKSRSSLPSKVFGEKMGWLKPLRRADHRRQRLATVRPSASLRLRGQAAAMDAQGRKAIRYQAEGYQAKIVSSDKLRQDKKKGSRDGRGNRYDVRAQRRLSTPSLTRVMCARAVHGLQNPLPLRPGRVDHPEELPRRMQPLPPLRAHAGTTPSGRSCRGRCLQAGSSRGCFSVLTSDAFA